MDRIDEIRARCDKASRGPWNERIQVYGQEVATVVFDADWCAITLNPKNSTFIAHSREDIPYLLAEIDRLTAELEAARKERDALIASIRGKNVCQTCIHTLKDGCSAIRNGWRCRYVHTSESVPCAENGGSHD